MAVLSLILTTTPQARFYTPDECLASAIYFESRGEAIRGRRAVYDVVLNRAKGDKKKVCAVLRERGQFSFVAKGYKDLTAQQQGVVLNPVLLQKQVFGKCTKYFHTSTTAPSWSKRLRKTGKIGNHIFYKENNCVD